MVTSSVAFSKMIRIEYFSVVATLLLAAVLFHSAQAEIKATAILFRHGQRTPETVFPKLPCAMCDDLGKGQLTNVSLLKSGSS